MSLQIPDLEDRRISVIVGENLEILIQHLWAAGVLSIGRHAARKAGQKGRDWMRTFLMRRDYPVPLILSATAKV